MIQLYLLGFDEKVKHQVNSFFWGAIFFLQLRVNALWECFVRMLCVTSCKYFVKLCEIAITQKTQSKSQKTQSE